MKASHQTNKILVSSTSNIAPYIAYYDKRSLDWRSVATECGLPIELLESTTWLPTKAIMLFIHKLDQKFGFNVSIEVGRQARISLLSPVLEEKIQVSDTLEEGVRALIDAIRGLSNHVTIWTEYKEGMWWLCHRSCYRPSTLGFEQA